ncbi:Hypothetical protein SRAE_2000455100 [Strongyloides ratti]|uniref:Uncharacterized protein n=1 Tax=Strongyloides ratti TaxID=34506 RepID=A0A090N017_STRRB|nr:Hypothetical protein SRAE_2000455100 [Strongyloides ratti]CEF69905.1 Hypothetical protein SRAE_2000455100 [Strongyloides ratti]
MAKYIILISIFFAFIIKIILSCVGFNCQPYSNTATITYQVEPSPSLTYNTNVTRVSGQYPTASSLAGNLVNIASNTINEAINQLNPYFSPFVSHRVLVNQFGLLNADIVPQTCPDNNQRTIAAAGTYYVLNNIVMQRVQPQNCSNGVVQPVPSTPALSTITYTINFSIVTGQVLCLTHWNTISNAIQRSIASSTGSNFLGSGIIERV